MRSPTSGEIVTDAIRRELEAPAEPERSNYAQGLLLFALTLLLFVGQLSLAVTAKLLVVLVAVLLLHELGHAMAMRHYKYRDLQILFLPFFGAVARGRKQDANPYERSTVALAGPLPGLLLGAATCGLGRVTSLPDDAPISVI
ncbi:MAG: hypothetical protein IPL79_16395 [Myxococcales bacterium]|nr:hypothetical protein [Myxococcales bacterium]